MDAGWIEPVPVPEGSRRPQRLRRAFTPPEGPIASALIEIAARGDVALFVNDVRLDGEGPSLGPAGEPVLRRYDAAGALRAGENVIGVILGESWGSTAPVVGERPYGDQLPPLAVLLRLEIVGVDGARTVVSSDGHFRATTGAIIYSEPGRGERQEHALRDAGWKLPGFDDSGWTVPRRSADQSHEWIPDDVGYHDEPRICVPAVRVTGEVLPVDTREAPGGGLLVDFGRRLVGRVRVCFDEPAGTEVTIEHFPLRPSRPLGEDAAPRVGVDVFVAAGTPDEVFEPGYSMHEFRWARVTGLTASEKARFSVLELSIPPAGDDEEGARR
jgi:alpha-L-rhamnosidase